MPYEAAMHAQDATTGRIGDVLRGISRTAARVGSFTAIDVAVAYATAGGVGLLAHELSASPAWSTSQKRWLISIDFGITQPSALRTLANLPFSEVRIPNGVQVASSAALLPTNTFHAKGYVFRSKVWGAPLGLVVGSANLSVSALATGSEIVSSQVWEGALTASEQSALDGASSFADWYEDAWCTADALATVLAIYKKARRRAHVRGAPHEDRTPLARAASVPSVGNVISGPFVAQLAAARALWVKTGHLYVNMPNIGVGNQLDMPRGTRVFFGFSSLEVPPNSVLGEVEMQAVGYKAVPRSVRFGNNFMDKVNLPIPGRDAPSSYDDAIIIFERNGKNGNGQDRFRLHVTDARGLAARRSAAVNAVDLRMQGGREYGLFF